MISSINRADSLKEAMGELRQEIQRYGSSGRQSDIEEQKNGEVTEK